MASVLLHKVLGLNPRMTTCPICHETGDEIILLGNRNWKMKCQACGVVEYGGSTRGVCPRCKSGNRERIELTDSERIVQPGPCRKCRDSAAKLVCNGCHKQIAAIQPGQTKEGFAILPNAEYHTQHCPKCSGLGTLIEIIEMKEWFKAKEVI